MNPIETATASESAEAHELVVRAREGDAGAFAELVRRYQRPVRAYVTRWVRDVHAADDVAQEVFVAAFQQLTSYSGSSEFLAWLLGIARNKALVTLRAWARRQRHLEFHADQFVAQRRAEVLETAGVDVELEQRRHELLRDCLNGLTPGARALVTAHYFEEKSTEQIAASLQRKSGAVRMTLLRIRRALSDCLRRKFASEEVSSS